MKDVEPRHVSNSDALQMEGGDCHDVDRFVANELHHASNGGSH